MELSAIYIKSSTMMNNDSEHFSFVYQILSNISPR